MGKSKSTPSKSDKSEGRGKANSRPISHEPTVTYLLSEPKYIDLGWTILPGERPMKRIVTYGAQLAKPNIIWNRTRAETETKLYEDGETFAEFRPDGNASIFYPDGRPAITLRRMNEGTRFRVKVTHLGGRDERAGINRRPTLAGLFDAMGNGVLYDYCGNIRIHYSQREGVLYETRSDRPVHWRWPTLFEIADPPDQSPSVLTREEIFNFYNTNSTIAAFPTKTPPLDVNLESKKDLKKDKINSSTVNTGSESESKKEEPQIKKSKDGKMSPEGKEIRSSAKKSSKKIISPGRKESSLNSEPMTKIHSDNLSNIKFSKSSKASEDRAFLTGKTPGQSVAELAALLHSEMLGHTAADLDRRSEQKKHQKSTCTPIKTIVLRVNRYVSFRLVDQANMRLEFKFNKYQIRLELGVVLDPTMELRTDLLRPEVVQNNKVPCAFETYLAKSRSMRRIMKGLQDIRRGCVAEEPDKLMQTIDSRRF